MMREQISWHATAKQGCLYRTHNVTCECTRWRAFSFVVESILRTPPGDQRPDRLTNLGVGTEDLGRALKDFEIAAAKFKADNNRLAVLVYDNINIVAEKGQDLLRVFQVRAKFAADKDLYKVVFVCSDRVAPARMKGERRPVSQLGMYDKC